MPKETGDYLPNQYEKDSRIKINHNYLIEQFSDYKEIFEGIEKLITGDTDFTLGKPVEEFQMRFAELCQTKYALGVNSGTDALFLSLKTLGIGNGDEVITTPYTFFATTEVIANSGAKPVFVDIGDDYNLNPDLIEGEITKKTKAIIPVHWSGNVCEMEKIMGIANRRGLYVIEDACQAVKATLKGKPAGSFGATGCFSLHPLKNLNVWGDGGVITTDSDELYSRLILLRNHGLANRNESSIYGYNSRLDSIQAIVANQKLKSLEEITQTRISNAALYDELLSDCEEIKIPERRKDVRQVYHLYIIRAKNRDGLQEYLIANGIDAKVHYPIPMHLQPATKSLGYKEGDFPVAEATCKSILSLPVHEFITKEQQEYVAGKIKEFYSKR